MNLKQFLLKNGPYAFEINFKSLDDLVAAQGWLLAQGDTDWEELIDKVDKKGRTRHYLFLQNGSHASYVKLVWG